MRAEGTREKQQFIKAAGINELANGEFMRTMNSGTHFIAKSSIDSFRRGTVEAARLLGQRSRRYAT